MLGDLKGTLKNNQLFLFSLLVAILLAVLLVNAAVGGYTAVDVINTSSTGFKISSNNGLTTNGSHPFLINTSGFIDVNISLIRNGTHGQYVNVTFSWVLSQTNGSTMRNATIINNSLNQSVFNFSFNSAGVLPDGYYNISIHVENATNYSADIPVMVANYSRGFDVLIDNFAPRVLAFWFNMTNNSNITGSVKFIINATVNDTIFTQSVRLGVRNTFNNNTEFNITTTVNMTQFAAELNTNLLTDGIYIITLYANDSLKNNNVTVSNLTFVLDRTGPNVTNIFLGNFTNGANISNGIIAGGTAVLSITVEANDSLTSNPGTPTTNLLAQVYVNITNSTGQINYTSAVANLSLWNSSLSLNISDTRYFPDGKYYILIYANDSLNNRNITQNLTFTIDRTLPSASVACSPSEPTAGQTVTCTCSISDAGSGLAAVNGFGTGLTTESTTATGSGSFTSSTCTATDFAGNRNTATGTWTVTAASAGGGGGSGSGGGSSSGVADQFEKKVWTSINAGETASMTVSNGVIGVSEVSFSVADTAYGAWVQVKKVDSLPSSVSSFEQEVYSTIEITEQNVEDALSGSATVKFKVSRSWLTENSLSSADIALFRYVDSSWTELTTTVGQDDGTYVHYTASTPGFSYFVIGEKAEMAVPEAGATQESPEAAPVGEEAAGETVEGSTVGSTGSNAVVWIVPLIVLLVVVGLLYWYWQRR